MTDVRYIIFFINGEILNYFIIVDYFRWNFI